MILDLYTKEEAQGRSYLDDLPAAQEDATFSQSYAASRDAAIEARQSGSYLAQRHAVVQAFLDRVYDKTGESLPNPENVSSADISAIELQSEPMPNLKAGVLKRLETIGNTPNLPEPLTYPNEEFIHAEAIKRMAGPLREERLVGERPQTWASSTGAFLGGMRGAVTDPVRIMSMVFGSSPGAGILKTILVEALVNAGSEAVVQAAIYPHLKEADPSHTIGQAAESVGEAAMGAAVIGGGVKALARGWAAWRRSGAPMPSEIRDAGHIVSREASVASAPSHIQSDIEAAPAHRAAVASVETAIAEQRAPELPLEVKQILEGRTGKVYTPEGRDVPVRYEVVDAGSLRTSHRDDFSLNPDYPPELQPRDRTRAASQTQIAEMAGDLKPELLGPSADSGHGAPVVGPDNIVESGNARTMAIRKAYEAGAGDGYRAHLDSLGFDTTGIERPVLIARRAAAMTAEERQAFTVSANRAGTLQLSASERAQADARLLTPALLREPDQTRLVRGFLDALPAAERGNLATKAGVMSQEGEARLRAALLARAYGDPNLLNRVLESPDNNIKTIGNAMADEARSVAMMKDAVAEGRIPPGMDITPDLLSAVGLVVRARDLGAKLSDIMNQAEMFGGPSEIAKLIGRFLFKDGDLRRPASQKAITRFLSDYAEEAQKNTTDARLFGEPLQAADVLEASLKKAGREDLAGLARDAFTPENIERLATDAKVDDVLAAHGETLQRENYFSPEAKVDMTDEAGADTMASFSQMMRQADIEEQAGKSVEGCLGGQAEAAPADAASKELAQITQALKAPRSVQFDAEGNVTGIKIDMAGAEAPPAGVTKGQQVAELIDVLRRGRRTKRDETGQIVGDELA